jgi:hypothetical protein
MRRDMASLPPRTAGDVAMPVGLALILALNALVVFLPLFV